MTFPFMPAFHSDILWRPVKFVRRKVQQQALLAVYNDPPDFESSMAFALDSGREFPNVHTGASGLGYTVLTQGLVCFGKPRDGPACFLAAPNYRIIGSLDDFRAIQRGIIEPNDEDQPELKFRDIGGGAGLVALTFAGQAFHAVYLEGSDFLSSRIATSFDGVNWEDQEGVFPETEFGTVGGAVAFNGNPEDLLSGNYAAAGNVQIEVPDEEPIWFTGAIENLAWATAVSPSPPEEGEPPEKTLSWSYGSNESVEGNPGAIMARSGVQNQQATIAGGNDIFAASTYEKVVEVIDINPTGVPIERTFLLYTAAVASSSNGGSWDNHELEGVQKGLSVQGPGWESGESRTIATVFVRDKTPENSYFVCAAYNYFAAHGEPDGSTWCTVHKSYDGRAWTLVRSVGAKGDGGKNICGALSVIDANLDNTTIITLV